MYLEKIEIKKFRVLEDIEVRFQSLNSDTACLATGNIVNVIAGVNGCGKTSLLEAIYGFSGGDVKLLIHRDNASTDNRAGRNLRKIIYVKFGNMTYRSNNNTTPKGEIEPKHIISGDGLLAKIEGYIRDFVLSIERKSFQPDPVSRTKEAIDQFNSLFEGVLLNTKLEALDSELHSNRPLFCNLNNSGLTIDQLSDGEKQLYGKVVGLEMLKLSDSIILIDEAELGLHPAWQQKIVELYLRIGQCNQFIIATHSPQIIANTPYQNLILLHKQDDKIVRLYPSQPPSGVDVNSILSEIMWVEQFLPQDVLELREQYRHLIEQKLENSPEAEAVKQKLLQRESNDSKFMQEMRFLLRLRGGQ
jgi:predicted ATP-binding protein involved in virulence